MQQAHDYFKPSAQNAADRFFARYKRARKIIETNPLVSRLRPTGWRQLTIPGSTFAIFYREAPDFWYLGGVISTVQDPDLIQARLLIREISEASPPAE